MVGASPIGSGVDLLIAALVIAAFALLSGVAVQVTQKYVPSNIAGWILMIVGFGVLSLLKYGDSTSQWLGYQVLCAAGIGLLVRRCHSRWSAHVLTLSLVSLSTICRDGTTSG